MSRWRSVVRRELHRYREQTGYDVVARQDLLDQSLAILKHEFPDASTPGQTLSRVLQGLRDRGEVEFLDYEGTYRIGELAYDPEPGITTAPDAPVYEATTYESAVQARSIPTAFRDAVLSWYDTRCPVSGIDQAELLDVAHILSWSDYPDHRTDPENVFALDKTHHEAFDRGLFTIDEEYCLQVAPEFTTESDLLAETLLKRDGEKLPFAMDHRPSADRLTTHNATLDWM